MRFSLFQMEEQNPSWQSAPGFVDWQKRHTCSRGKCLRDWGCCWCCCCWIPELLTVDDEVVEVKWGEFQPPPPPVPPTPRRWTGEEVMACFVSSQNEFSVGVADLLEDINQSLPLPGLLQPPLVVIRWCCWFCCDDGGCSIGEDGAQITILLLALLLLTEAVVAVTADVIPPPVANGPIPLVARSPALDCFRNLATWGGGFRTGVAGVIIVTASNSEAWLSPAALPWDDKLLGAPAEQQKNPVTKPEK